MPTKNALFTLQDDLIDRYNSKDDDETVVPFPKPTPEEEPEDLPMVACGRMNGKATALDAYLEKQKNTPEPKFRAVRHENAIDVHIKTTAKQPAKVCTLEHTLGYNAYKITTARQRQRCPALAEVAEQQHAHISELTKKINFLEKENQTWLNMSVIFGVCCAGLLLVLFIK